MKDFIETFDSENIPYLINISQIAFIKDIDKYTREIRLSITDQDCNPVVILSGHSYQELLELIKEAQEDRV